jgi:hypothetical protein
MHWLFRKKIVGRKQQPSSLSSPGSGSEKFKALPAEFFCRNDDKQNMKIESSMVALSSNHWLENTRTRSEKLDAWVDPPHSERGVDRVTLSRHPNRACQADHCDSARKKAEDPVEGNPKLFLIQKIIEKLTGRTIRLAKLNLSQETPEAPSTPPQEESANQTQRAGWGVRYEAHETYVEKEETNFHAGGAVRTADGKEIQFAVDLQMSREFVQSTDVSIRAGDAALADPLVVNFDGTAAQLTDQTFAFDLNADGQEEEIPLVAGGSGVLVFDRNQDGKVNDGTELFGPSTGNGFAELSQYDEDGNLWIDESDAIFRNLFVWTRSADNQDTLQSLKDSGIGALSLSSVNSPFALKDSQNQLRGQIVRTGVFLREDGGAGTLQQLNVVI